MLFDTIKSMMKGDEDENLKKVLLGFLIPFAFSHKNKLLILEWLQKGITLPKYTLQRVF